MESSRKPGFLDLHSLGSPLPRAGQAHPATSQLVRLGSKPLRLSAGTPMFAVSWQQFLNHAVGSGFSYSLSKSEILTLFPSSPDYS